MQVAHKIDIDRLDKKVNVISDLLAKLGDEDDLRRLVREWRKPGWTTPAEFILVSAMLENFEHQAKGLLNMKSDLVRGAEAVTAGN
jgi:hypothetical protein